MKFIFLFVTLFFSSLLVGCGGGGGGGGGSGAPAVAIYEKTITTFDTANHPLSSPKLMTFSGVGLLTVVDHASIVTFDINNSHVTSEYFVTAPFGVAVKPGTNSVYYTGGAPGNQGVYSANTSIPIPNTSANLYGIAFTNAQDWYVANVAGSILIYANNQAGTTSSVAVPAGLPSSLIANNGLIYVSLAGPSASILEFNPANVNAPNHGFTVLPWGTFDFPNGMAVDGGYLYIANAGDANGNNGYVSRVKISDGTKEVFASASAGVWQTARVGFCGPAGLAIYDKYLYVSNGTCTTGVNQNSILKIKLP